MQRLTQPLEEHHGFCDGIFADAENAALKDDWAEAARKFADFRQHMEGHFRVEESLLFPDLEQATGNPWGPTEVMRGEHRHMREMMAAMGDAIRDQDESQYTGLSETLLIMMQQHNHKEEGILYPMCDSALPPDGAKVAEQLAKETATAA